MILTVAGYGIRSPRYSNRNAKLRGEVDAVGRPVVPVDHWRVVEVGSYLEDQARAAGEFTSPPKERSK